MNFEFRRLLPPGDILIRAISYKRTTIDGVDVPYHMDVEVPGSFPPRLMKFFRGSPVTVAYHHSVIHQGVTEKVRDTPGTFHAHGALIFGTRAKTTSFFPWVIRLRNEARLFTCIHAFNALPGNKTFLVHWEIEYSLAPNPNLIDNAIFVGMTYVGRKKEIWRKNGGQHDRIRFWKDVDFLGTNMHLHSWVTFAQVRSMNQTLLWEYEAATHNDTDIAWLPTPERILAGQHVDLLVRGSMPDMGTPFAFTFFFHCLDGTDTLKNIRTVYTWIYNK